MADTSSTFIKRVISGALGGVALLAIGYFGGTQGLQLVCVAATILAVREYSRMVFPSYQMPKSVAWSYWIICVGLYTAMYRFAEWAMLEFAISAALFMAASLWLSRGKVSNENLLPGMALGIFGLLYCVLFPFFALKLVTLDEGAQWFLFLLLVVFFGDTFAYFGGRWFGKHKMMPQVSPNKTWEGAIGGLLGSCVAGSVHVAATFQEVPFFSVILFCIVCGMAAQSGDLLMSLIKRVAHVKDSGTIMPGHGGLLDRVDGIFIACPLVYGFALYARPF